MLVLTQGNGAKYQARRRVARRPPRRRVELGFARDAFDEVRWRRLAALGAGWVVGPRRARRRLACRA